MNEDKKTFLPIGTVALLKNGKRKIMIIGINQRATSDNKVYDYSSVVYPFGYLRSDELFFFNSGDIDKVVSLGYSDEEMQNYYDDVIWAIDNNKEKNNG